MSDVKLMGSGQVINIGRLPVDLASVIIDIFSKEKDPYTILAAYGYIFSGLSIDEIRERFIITDGVKSKIASREFIRQKIKKVYLAVKGEFVARYDIDTVTSIETGNLPDNIFFSNNTIISEREENDNSEEIEKVKKVRKKRQEAKSKEDTTIDFTGDNMRENIIN